MELLRCHRNRAKRKQIAINSNFGTISGGTSYGGNADKIGVSHVEISLESVQAENEYFRLCMTPEEAVKCGERIAELGRKYLAEKKGRELAALAGEAITNSGY